MGTKPRSVKSDDQHKGPYIPCHEDNMIPPPRSTHEFTRKNLYLTAAVFNRDRQAIEKCEQAGVSRNTIVDFEPHAVSSIAWCAAGLRFCSGKIPDDDQIFIARLIESCFHTVIIDNNDNGGKEDHDASVLTTAFTQHPSYPRSEVDTLATFAGVSIMALCPKVLPYLAKARIGDDSLETQKAILRGIRAVLGCAFKNLQPEVLSIPQPCPYNNQSLADNDDNESDDSIRAVNDVEQGAAALTSDLAERDWTGGFVPVYSRAILAADPSKSMLLCEHPDIRLTYANVITQMMCIGMGNLLADTDAMWEEDETGWGNPEPSAAATWIGAAAPGWTKNTGALVFDQLRSQQASVRGMLRYAAACWNSDNGGFGNRPGAESHAGHTYCAVSLISVLNGWQEPEIYNVVDTCRVLAWLKDRAQPCGGFNGRPGKPVDCCYAFWVSAAWSNIGQNVWDLPYAENTYRSLVSSVTTTGGFTKRPRDPKESQRGIAPALASAVILFGEEVYADRTIPDHFHTCFGLAALALYRGQHRLEPIDRGPHPTRRKKINDSLSNLSKHQRTWLHKNVSCQSFVSPFFALPQEIIDIWGLC